MKLRYPAWSTGNLAISIVLTAAVVFSATTNVLAHPVESAKGNGAVLRIPVVVHVLYFAGSDISDATVVNYIQTVNKNLRKQRPAQFTPRPIFDSLWADTEIELCLATMSPAGQTSTGITHTLRTSPLQGGNNGEDAKYSSSASGGIDPWPVDQYLNIWIGPFGSLDPDWSGFTVNNNICARPNSREGIVINAAIAGVITNIITHEVGHFTGLHHTFDNAVEGIDDTPYEGGNHLTKLQGMSCDPSDQSSNTSVQEAAYWGNNNPPDMIENFMGYDIACQFMFTKGQKLRMHTMLETYYATLISRSSCNNSSGAGPALSVKAGHFTLYPNPGHSSISILNDGMPASTPFVVYGMSGTLVAHGVIGSKAITLPILPSGVYLVKAGAQTSKLIIID